MAGGTYDIITIGGGLGGSTLAKAMAEHGARVPGVGARQQFKDRVRGEIMALGVWRKRRRWASTELLHDLCTRNALVSFLRRTRARSAPRPACDDAPACPRFRLYHPTMQSVAAAAADAGAEVVEA